ncbi:MAG: GTPase HflX [Spirochaetales bacterium]|nr:GTPase HflX [Spirochaetales bacterium]
MFSESSSDKLNFDFQNLTAVVVSLKTSETTHEEVDYSVSEIIQLAKTLGVTIKNKFIQSRKFIDSAYYIGQGKLEEIRLYMTENNIDILIFDNELSGIQERNIEKFVGKPILDRTAIILNIFKKRAKSNEAKLQVELAALEYQMPRLRNMWTHFSRSEGVVGIRGGEGEKQLELDKRMIKNRITAITKRLEKIDTQMKTRRKKRSNSMNVSLAGYTNAGKTSLMNLLSKKTLFAENMMFSTIDSTVRKVYINDDLSVLLNDTVGFINKLPCSLVASFKSTLDEILGADLILHVIDISSEFAQEHINSVEQILREIGADHIPVIKVYNKADLLDNMIESGTHILPDDILISTYTKQGIDILKERISQFFLPNNDFE